MLFAGCSRGADDDKQKGVSIRIPAAQSWSSKLVDEDNPASEQVIRDLTLFFTEPSSDIITHTFVHPGFTAYPDYSVVTVPIEPEVLQTRDIYVVTNYGETDLNTVTTISQLRDVTAPYVDKTNNLDPAEGFCMYGMTAGFDFTSGQTAIVNVVRACAKYRISLSFPQGAAISTDNRFLIANAAHYTYIIKNPTAILTSGDYFNFAAELPLEADGQGYYTNTVYTYEAAQAPVLYLYTHMGGSAVPQEFSADLPLPVRNHFYQIDVLVYQPELGVRSAGEYCSEIRVTTYDGDGRIVE